MDEIKAAKKTPADSRYISTTDPDASVTRHGKGKSTLRYKTQRVIDEKHEIITATKVSPGSVDDGQVLEDMIEAHEHNTQQKLETAVADSEYGTIENFLLCHDRQIKAHIPSIEKTCRGTGRQKGIFPKEAFSYDPEMDTFICPAGKRCAYEVNQAAPTKTCWTPTEKRGAGKVREPGISGRELGRSPAGGSQDRMAFGGTVSPVLFHRDQFKACRQ